MVEHRGISGKGEVLDNPAIDEVFLNDALEHFRCAGVIPDRLRVNHCDGSFKTHPQAIGFCAIDQRLGPDQVKLLEPTLQVFPRLQAHGLGGAFGFSLISAKKDMPPVPLQAEGSRNGLQFGAHIENVSPRPRSGYLAPWSIQARIRPICSGVKGPIFALFLGGGM